MTDKPDLHKLFMVDDKSVATRAMLSGLGHHMHKLLASGQQTVSFQVDRDVATLMADLFILEEEPYLKR